MQLISVKVHEGIDCAAALVFICSPWMFDFSDGKAAQWVPISIGIIIILMSLCTDYGLGVFKLIPFKIHLRMDVLAGLLLSASPWLFGFHGEVFLPHLILGILEIGAALLTTKDRSEKSVLV